MRLPVGKNLIDLEFLEKIMIAGYLSVVSKKLVLSLPFLDREENEVKYYF